jgi:hypothetical protein
LLADRWAERDYLRDRLRRLRIAPRDLRGDAVEVALESVRGDDEERAGGRSAQVGVGVRDAARSEGELARAAGDELVAEKVSSPSST